jgi:phosphoribosyl 1,2-cyclic phosphodiesterase
MSAPGPPLEVTYHGVRGSLPSPGPATVEYGGNTACLAVSAGDQLIVLDAGSGIRSLGAALARGRRPSRIDVFLSHFHLDHILGFPFFAPLYEEDAVIVLHAPRLCGWDAGRILDVIFGPPFFPLGSDAIRPRLRIETVDSGAWRAGALEVAALPVPHPGGAVGYRVSDGRTSLAYVPDCELSRAGRGEEGGAGYEEIRRFVEGVDLLVHDAMYTPLEAAGRRGWGHSTWEEALELAVAAGVARLAGFHHDPGRSDRVLARLEEALGEACARRNAALSCGLAREGVVVALS